MLYVLLQALDVEVLVDRLNVMIYLPLIVLHLYHHHSFEIFCQDELKKPQDYFFLKYESIPHYFWRKIEYNLVNEPLTRSIERNDSNLRHLHPRYQTLLTLIDFCSDFGKKICL